MKTLATIELDLPETAVVKGELYDSLEPALLLQDILEVELSDEMFIDVGWYPEHHPDGSFWIRVFYLPRTKWESQGSVVYRARNPIGRAVKVKNPKEAQAVVELLAAVYSAK